MTVRPQTIRRSQFWLAMGSVFITIAVTAAVLTVAMRNETCTPTQQSISYNGQTHDVTNVVCK
jgi:uncharacterized membrane protein YhaH (DUF805 family)